MPASVLMDLAKSANYEAFEAKCIEMLADGQLTFHQLVAPYQQFEQAGKGEKLVALTQTIFENSDTTADPRAALALARAALTAGPKNDAFRAVVLDLYRASYADVPNFDGILEASGLSGGRPVRMALKLLDFCLSIKPGDPLISRSDDRVVEVTEVDAENVLFTLKREGRTLTLPAPEVVRDYDRVASDDFRVLRQLHPARLVELVERDPVAVVVGLVRAHGQHIDSDQLKDELVPRYVDDKEWSSWWTKTRTALRKSRAVTVEGRSPIIISLSQGGLTIEERNWGELKSQREPAEWQTIIEGYVREKTSLGETPDPLHVSRCLDHVWQQTQANKTKRPADALAGALVLLRLSERGLSPPSDPSPLAAEVLGAAPNPLAMINALSTESLRDRAIDVLPAGRPEDWVDVVVRWLPDAPAGLMDKLAAAAIANGRHDAVQAVIDAALDEPADHPELMYWMWKGPRVKGDLRFPDDDVLFRVILDTFSTLGRTVSAEAGVVKEFRGRMKSALGIRDYERSRRCIERISEAAAIVVRRQLQRLEGVGPTVQAKLLELLREAHPVLWVVKPKTVAPWEDPDTIWTTGPGLQRRTSERDHLVNVEMRDNARRIGEAAQLGDLSENSEYKFALEERDLLRARLAAMNDELSRARKIDVREVPEESVGVGSRVTLRRLSDGVEQDMAFLGPFDTDVERRVYSYQAPFAQKLMGQRVGARLTVNFEGRDTECELIAIGNAVAELPHTESLTEPRPEQAVSTSE